jgi:hypothetical protein
MEDEEYDENDPDPCDREFDRWRDRELEVLNRNAPILGDGA